MTINIDMMAIMTPPVQRHVTILFILKAKTKLSNVMQVKHLI